MKILLLGSTGLLGRNVLNILLERGYEVVAFVRNSHGIKDIDNKALTIVEGKLTNKEAFRKAAKGCEAIINCVGTTDMSLLRYEDYLPMNRELCRTLVELSETTDTKIVVHVSSANTIGYGDKANPSDEAKEMREPFASSYYARSKREGEMLLEKAALKNPDCHYIILNPGFMIGAWDSKPSSGQLLLAGYKRRFMVAPGGGKSFVAVKDVAAVAVAALTRGKSGERYLLTGEELMLSDFYRRQATLCGYKQKILILPRWILSIAGAFGDLLRIIHIPTQVSTNNIKQLSVMEYYSSKKAKEELGFEATSIDKAIVEFFEWYNRNKRSNKNCR